MKRTIIVTGGTGLLGKVLVVDLLKMNYNIVLTTRDVSKRKSFIEETYHIINLRMLFCS